MDIKQGVDFASTFIGTVSAIDATTRKVAVYLPKLMPAIVEGTSTKESITNYGNSYINIKYNTTVKTRSSLWVNAMDTDAPMPTIGSKVRVSSIEGNPYDMFWRRFNPDGDYTEIDDEKYKSLYSISIDDKIIPISESDVLSIVLPDSVSSIYTYDGKTKTITLSDITTTDTSDTESTDIIFRVWSN